MTYRELLMRDKPKWINPNFPGGCLGCPGDVYLGTPIEEKPGCLVAEAIATRGHIAHRTEDRLCRACWDQEAPEGTVANGPITKLSAAAPQTNM